MKKEVRGVAFEGEDIFVVLEGLCEIKVFNSTTLESKDSIFLADLSDPWDILALEGHIFVTENRSEEPVLYAGPTKLEGVGL